MEWWLALIAGIFGLLVGSFINVLSLRFGFFETTRHRSQCQACHATLKWFELLPLVSFALLSGRCRSCGSALSMQYPLVELLVGGLFFWAFIFAYPFLTLYEIFAFAVVLFFWASFVLLVIYDMRHTLVPLHFVLPLFIGTVAIRLYEWNVVGSPWPLYDGLLGALILGGFIALIVLLTRGRGMGVGDIYIAIILGGFFGVSRGVEVLMLAFWIGAVVGIGLMLYSLLRGKHIEKRLSSQQVASLKGDGEKRFRMKSEVPFVPFLFLAAVIGAYTDISPFALVASITQYLWF